MKDFLDEIEKQITSGQGKAAGAKLLAVDRAKIPVSLRGRFAALARRANLVYLALRVLNPAVRPAGRKIPTATESEIANYSASLIRIGAAQEALDLLTKLNETLVPETLLFQCFVHFSRWKYDEAIPLLERYIRHPALSDYQRTIGKTNLAAALVHEKHPSAQSAVVDLVEETKKRNYRLLLANAYLLGAELEVALHKWGNAERRLGEAEGMLTGAQSLETLFVQKWKAIIVLYRRKAEESRLVIDRVRASAVRMKHWETLRDCDYHQAIATQDTKLFMKNYFGTPYEGFRQRLLKDFGRPVAIDAEYKWSFGPSHESPMQIDLFSAGAAEGVGLKSGQTLHRTLNILSRDFYRPVRLAALHDALCPGEYFNPVSSPSRVHQAVKRLKQWLHSKRLPLRVYEDDSSYSLFSESACELLIPLNRNPVSRREALLTLLRERAGDNEFSAAQASKMLKINAWAAIRLVKYGKSSHLLEVIGGGTKVRYRFLRSRPLISSIAS